MKKKIKHIDTEGYEVGYGKPPKSGRFKKGLSGNPLGRPQKPLDLRSGLVQALNSKVFIIENGKRRQIKMVDVFSKQLVNKAASGNVQSQRLLLNYCGQIQECSAEQQQNKRPVTVKDLTDEELMLIAAAGQKEPGKTAKAKTRRRSRRRLKPASSGTANLPPS